MVDEAHGAHFGFHEGYPESAVRLGADIVIHSLHKTLPSMTQTALLHVSGNLVDRRRLERYLRIFQTSSPSYVLMASMSSCLEIVEKDGWALLEKLRRNRERLEGKLNACKHIVIFRPESAKEGLAIQWDICKFTVGIKGRKLTGQQLYDILRRKYHLQMEMAADGYVLAILTLMDKEEGMDRLADALVEIDGMMGDFEKEKSSTPEGEIATDQTVECPMEKDCVIEENEIVMPIYQAYDKEQELIPVEKGCGRVSAEFIHLYPPGIPLVAPGERMDGARIRQILDYMASGLTVQGLEKGNIRVLKAE